MAFTHLHVHTEYSLLDGSNKIKEYVKRLKELGMDSGAITDHGVMFGVIDFYKECKAQGVKPILGCEVYVAPKNRFLKEVGVHEDRYYHLVLLAENNQGYENLMKIVSRGFTEGYYYKPRVDLDLLREYHEGIICLSACLAGEIPRYIEKHMIDEAEKAALRYLEIFGEGNFFLEMQDHGIPEQRTVNAALMTMSQKLHIPMVCTNDVHYTYATDADAHDILLCVQTGKKLQDEDRMRYEGGQYYLKSEDEMRLLFPYATEALENTAKIAERCNVEIEFGVTKVPHFEVPEGYNSLTYLRYLCDEGMKERYPDDDGTLRERMNYELGVIEKMGYVDYFLIVWDYINWAKEHDIPVGPGRGSAAGSIVSYCLHITDIDPIRYNLLFERFLNPERVSMPDIDVDFCFERRQEVIDYVRGKYGDEKVVQIVTFGTMAAKGVLRDVGRVMDMPYAAVDAIAKMVPNELNITLERALQISPDLKNAYETDEQIHHLIDMSLRLEGLPRNTSMHAAGVVICSQPAENFVPLSLGADGSVTTQFTMTTIEELGLLKMDFLGLRTLTVIKNACRLVEKSRGIRLDMDAIDYNDAKVLSYISSGKTEGVFQLESGGMKSFMKELKPQNLEDIIAGISLYRPGPMDFIPKYIAGKNNGSAITYLCPQLEPILSPTYGCIVYQEQVMQIVRDLGGYTLGRSDLVRRAMSKKKQHVMEEERKNFIFGNESEGVPGCISKGISEDVAGKIYDEMMDFAKYAFNKSHAACYAVVSYQTAYLKCYYPVEFMAALMTSVIDNPGKVAEYILVCREMGIEILPPDINESEEGFTVAKPAAPLGGGETPEGAMAALQRMGGAVSGAEPMARAGEHAPAAKGVRGAIRYALTAIKSVGRPVIEAILDDRAEHGKYSNLQDFITRVGSREVNKRAIENFIKSGAFDSLGGTRKQFMSIYVKIMDSVHQDKNNNMAGQMSLFDFVEEDQKQSFEVKLPDVGEYSKDMMLAFEKEVMGIYVSGHPLQEYEDLWNKHATAKTTDFKFTEEEEPKVVDQSMVTIGGIISECKIKYTKTNKIMAFLTVEDLVGSIEVIVFPRDYDKYREKLTEDAKVFIQGRVSLEEEKDGKLIASKITLFHEIPKKLWIKFPTLSDYEAQESGLMNALAESEGNDQVVIYIEDSKLMRRLPPQQAVSADAALVGALEERFGEDNIRVV